MLNVFLAAVLACFALLGLVHVIRWAALHIFTPKDAPLALLVRLRGDGAEVALRAAAERVRFEGKIPTVLAVEVGLDGEALAVCRAIQRENANITLCTPDDVMQWLRDSAEK